MFLEIFLVASVLGIIYGIGNFSLPKEVIAYNSLMFLGKFRHATHWMLFLVLLSVFLLFLRKTGLKMATKPLRWILSITLPNLFCLTAAYWYITLKDFRCLSDSENFHADVSIPLITRLCQHVLPLVTILAVWYEAPISLCRKIHAVNFVIVFLYAILSTAGRFISKKWPYPFMDHLSVVCIPLIFAAYYLASVLLYEVFMFIENARRKRKIQERVFKNK